MTRQRQQRMKWLGLFIILAMLPALACSTLFGPDEEESTVQFEATVDAIVEEAVSTVPAQVTLEISPLPTLFPTEELITPGSGGDESTGGSGEGIPAEDALDAIFGAQRSGLAVDALRVTMVNENLTTEQSDTTVIEFVRPGDFRMAGQGFQMIVVDGQTYIQDEGGNWLVSPIEMGDMFQGLFDAYTNQEYVDSLLEDLEVTITDVVNIGEEVLNGVSTRVYSYSSQTALTPDMSKTTIWIGVDDGLVYQQQIEQTLNGEDTRMTMTYEYEDVVIEAPLP